MSEKKSFVRVDELLPQISLEQAAAFYGFQLPELKRVGQETRARCFLLCGRTEETGDRALAIQADSPTKIWKCHQYGCGKGSNLVGICDLMKPGENAGGRPRGERFTAIAQDLAAMARGESSAADKQGATYPAPNAPKLPTTPKVNIPLAESDNERARGLTALDEQFVSDPAEMPPEAASYFRRRPFLTSEVCRRFRVGYLPRSCKSLLRGKIVYPYFSSDGALLTWFGRDPSFEEKHRQWLATDRSEPEPVKTQFVKGFHRGLELWGEHLVRADEGRTYARNNGLVIVEGPNDAINLHALGVPAVALCSNTITREQAERIAALACDLGAPCATLMLDCDAEGENGIRQALPLLAERVPARLGWSHTMHAGKFKGRQPESLGTQEWHELCKELLRYSHASTSPKQ